MKFTPSNEKKAKEILARYPHRQSAVMPFLTLAQKQLGGSLTQGAMEYVAQRLGMATIRVLEVATFYAMYRIKKCGKYHLAFCNSISCWLRGSERLIAEATVLTKSGLGKVSADGEFSMEEAPCLGACVNAPVVMVNDQAYVEELDCENLRRLIQSLRHKMPFKANRANGANQTSQPTQATQANPPNQATQANPPNQTNQPSQSTQANPPNQTNQPSQTPQLSEAEQVAKTEQLGKTAQRAPAQPVKAPQAHETNPQAHEANPQVAKTERLTQASEEGIVFAPNTPQQAERSPASKP